MNRIFHCYQCRKELEITQLHHLPGQDFFDPRTGLRQNTGENYCEECYEQLTQKEVKVKLSKEDLILNDDPELFEKLRRLRMQLAINEGLPAYYIFDDKTLQLLAEDRPRNRLQMLEISGIKEQKFNKYGKYFLEAIEEFCS